ncbi:MAG: YidC/Oxa1 family membrane protein insertase [Lachnospiraceae bacterium]|nr:YidC/Oxa1 family membrane protein insertase [Lachnospiraceae bacterium]
MLLTPYAGSILGPIAKAIGWIMNLIYMGMSAIGITNVGVSIILLTIVIYIILFPLTYRQQKFSKLSQKMQPELRAVQDKYKNKKDQASMQAMNAETQLVYQKYGISPMGSCLQLLIQMPILFALYRVFYNIPAYITNIKDQFSALVDGITGTSGFQDTMATVVTDFKISTLTKVDWAAESGSTLTNHIVDALYKLPSTAWDSASDNALLSYFPDLGDSISNTYSNIKGFNYFVGLNISDSPLAIIKNAFSTGVYWVAIIALLFPILSYLTQVLNIKLTPQTNAGDQTAQTMKTMNVMMPLMSLVFCFTLPVGLGIYWIAGALVRSVQQYFLNKHFDKIDLESIIEKNKEKVAKKKEKQGLYQDQIRRAAAIKTRSIDAKASMNVDSDDAALENALNIKSNAKAGSLASKANMVKNYNEKNSRK